MVTPLPVEVVLVTMVEEDVGRDTLKFCSIQDESPSMMGQPAVASERFYRHELATRNILPHQHHIVTSCSVM